MSKNIVLLVGAGASTGLGANEQPLPLMTTWADSLRGDLGDQLSSALGLSATTSGQDFEHQLGLFLQFHRTIDQYRTLFGIVPDYQIAQSARTWLDQTAAPRDNIILTLRKNLFNNFSRSRISATCAREAYSALVQLMSLNSVDGLTFATTNYDVAIELGLGQLGRPVVDGFLDNPYGPAVFSGDILASSDDSRSAYVLHLHGAAGWFRNGSEVTRYNTDKYFPEAGEPAVLFPDDQKSADSLVGMSAIWSTFGSALKRASHLLILGHSLNDSHISASIRQNLNQAAKILVTALPDQLDEMGERSAAILNRSTLRATLTFGSQLVGDYAAIRGFFENT